MLLLPSVSVIILIIAIVVNIILGVITFRNNPKSKTNLIFSLLTWITSIWLAVNYLSLQPYSISISLLLMRLSIFFAVPQIISVYLLAHTFPHGSIRLKKKTFYIVMVISLLIMLVNISPYSFTSLEIKDGSVQPVPGPGMAPFALFAVFFTFNALFTFVRRLRKSRGLERRQLRLVMIGVLIMFSLIIFTIMIPVALFKNRSFVVFSPLYTLVFLGLTSYAIVRYRLFDLKIIATEAVTIILWIVLFSKLFVSQSTTQMIVDSLILAIVVVFGVLLIRSVMREVAHREKLEELTRKLKEIDEKKDEFISMAAHELRAPMTAIKGYISMVTEGDAGDIPEKARGYLADANTINERLIRLVNNMLNVSRIEEGRMVFQMEVDNLSQVVRSAFAQFRPEAERKGLKFRLKIPTEIKDKVEVDPDRIHEIVANMLSNAVKYTEKGSVEIRLRQPNKDTVRFEVEDTGPGISKAEQGKLFQKFQRIESNIGKTTGTGLGLYICKLLVKKFNGELGLISESGKGSIFWFELPLKKG